MVAKTKTDEAKTPRKIRTIEERIAELQAQAEKKNSQKRERATAARSGLLAKITDLQERLIAARAQLEELDDLLGYEPRGVETRTTDGDLTEDEG